MQKKSVSEKTGTGEGKGENETYLVGCEKMRSSHFNGKFWDVSSWTPMNCVTDNYLIPQDSFLERLTPMNEGIK